MMNYKRKHSVYVTYFESDCNGCIQVADVFANIMFSNAITKNYEECIANMRKKGFMGPIFVFPLS